MLGGDDHLRARSRILTIFLIVTAVLVVALYALIAAINHGDHFAPQAYYRRKRGGAPLAHGHPSTAPRYRRRSPAELDASRRDAREG